MSESPTNQDILLAIGNLQGEMRGFNKSFDNHSDRMDSHSIRIDANAARIGTAENKQAWWAGAAAVLGIVGGFLLKKIGF